MFVLAMFFLIVSTLSAGFAGLVTSSAIDPHAYAGRDGEGAAGLAFLVVIAVGVVSILCWALASLIVMYLRKRQRCSARTAYLTYALPLAAFITAFGANWLFHRFVTRPTPEAQALVISPSSS